MTLPKEAYQALEDIVGPEYITREPAILDTYCFVWGNELIFGEKFSPRPPAVILPESTEEVQAIVRVCNRFGIRYRAHATGFETSSMTASKSFLPIDMRRMNRIVEIDRRNKFAVVEPYVSQAKLFLESMKVGLRPNMLGAGPSASVLAGVAAHFGSGPTSISTDFGGRNLLGLEWVMPDGDILRLGSLGAGAGWICGDGPGPSLRGVVRGYGGANGGIGIFTKAATKLYPWYGPPKLKVGGKPPNYEMEVPENFSVCCVVFPGKKHLNDFLHLLVEESIAFAVERPGTIFGTLLATESNDEWWELIRDIPQEQRRAQTYSVIVAFDASSAREMEYKERCFKAILQETQGMIFPFDEKVTALLFNTAVTAQGMTRAAFRAAGSFIISPVGDEAIDAMADLGSLSHDNISKDLQEEGHVVSGGGESVWSVPYGGDGCGHLESLALYDPADPVSCEKVAESMQKGDSKIVEWGLGINSLENALSYEESALKAVRPHLKTDFVKYMKKIKRAFDPNYVAESSFYVSPEEYE